MRYLRLWKSINNTTIEPKVKLNSFWFTRQLQLSERSNGLVETYDLKKRNYIGTTSFEAELSLVTCNLAQIAPGKITYDPFTGTGSFLVAAAHFGDTLLDLILTLECLMVKVMTKM